MKKNKYLLLFLLKFFGTYFLLFILYNSYLNSNQVTAPYFSCEPITQNVAMLTKRLGDLVGFPMRLLQSETDLSVLVYTNSENPIVAIVEGCNAISVIILFISFIVAFSGKFLTTSLYILLGSISIYFFNIFRIFTLIIIPEYYPNSQEFMHHYVFPTMIYGYTFLLWVLWIKKFASFNLKKKEDAQTA
ncbi:exosortase family protein XrtF [Aureivirga sp. CE67]|uniref:exosortase family protein XrtF n=1 Tax=Aureivirga sp. CE67 TaxID=1788983 RepID=UPI0018CA24B4|nr:exosortase family protein XrtF [Aureivirga sp. CE67]